VSDVSLTPYTTLYSTLYSTLCSTLYSTQGCTQASCAVSFTVSALLRCTDGVAFRSFRYSWMQRGNSWREEVLGATSTLKLYQLLRELSTVVLGASFVPSWKQGRKEKWNRTMSTAAALYDSCVATVGGTHCILRW
jgi:hypothetical protein